jgi:hypothetical protein
MRQYTAVPLYKKDDIPVFFQFSHDGFHPLFELTPVFGSCHQRREVQRNNSFIK